MSTFEQTAAAFLDEDVTETSDAEEEEKEAKCGQPEAPPPSQQELAFPLSQATPLSQAVSLSQTQAPLSSPTQSTQSPTQSFLTQAEALFHTFKTSLLEADRSQQLFVETLIGRLARLEQQNETLRESLMAHRHKLATIRGLASQDPSEAVHIASESETNTRRKRKRKKQNDSSANTVTSVEPVTSVETVTSCRGFKLKIINDVSRGALMKICALLGMEPVPRTESNGQGGIVEKGKIGYKALLFTKITYQRCSGLFNSAPVKADWWPLAQADDCASWVDSQEILFKRGWNICTFLSASGGATPFCIKELLKMKRVFEQMGIGIWSMPSAEHLNVVPQID